MGIAIRCILERDIPDVPHLEGKSLGIAFCGDTSGDLPGGDTSTNVISLDFGGGNAQSSNASAAPSPAESLLAPLDSFVAGSGAVQWHDAAKGLKATRSILKKLHEGATVTVAEDFPFANEDDDELTEGVRFDLEELEKILGMAQNAHVRFHLAFDV